MSEADDASETVAEAGEGAGVGPPATVQRYPLPDSSEQIAAFDALLRRLGIHAEPGSPLEAAFLALERLRGGVVSIEQAEEIVHALGLRSMVDRFTRLIEDGFAEQARPHLELLAQPSVTAAQNMRRRVHRDDDDRGTAYHRDAEATRKLFELVVGSLALRCAHDVVLEPPHVGESENPDILCTFEDVRWGIACKTVSGTSPLTFGQTLERAVQQIKRSPAQRGLVFVNPSDVLPYEQLHPRALPDGNFTAPIFDHARDALKIAYGFADSLVARTVDAFGHGYAEMFAEIGDGEARWIADVPAVVFYAELAILVRPADGGRHVWQQAFSTRPIPFLCDEIDHAAHRFMFALHEALRLHRTTVEEPEIDGASSSVTP